MQRTSHYRWYDNTLELQLRVVPRASKTELVGGGEGGYRVRLAAPPLEGKANACLLELLARSFGVPRSRVQIASGEHARAKTVRIEGPTRSPWADLPIGGGSSGPGGR